MDGTGYKSTFQRKIPSQLKLEIFPFQCHHNLILSKVRIKYQAVDCRLGSSSTQQNDKKVSTYSRINSCSATGCPFRSIVHYTYEHEPLVNSLESTCFASTACTLFSNCLKSLQSYRVRNKFRYFTSIQPPDRKVAH